MSSITFKQLALATYCHGTMVRPKIDSTIGRPLGLYGEFALGENRLTLRYVNPGDTVVDVGANLGTTVLPFARAVGPTGHVIVSEPQPLMAQCLQSSMTLNECFSVRFMAFALGHESGWVHIPTPDRGRKKTTLEQWTNSLFRSEAQYRNDCLSELVTAKRIALLLAFCFFYRSDNFRSNREKVFGGTGNMNALVLPANRPQPRDLPEVHSADEDWQKVYAAFHQLRSLEMP